MAEDVRMLLTELKSFLTEIGCLNKVLKKEFNHTSFYFKKYGATSFTLAKFADWNEQIRKHRSLWSYHNCCANVI